jgi:hypothetical protein
LETLKGITVYEGFPGGASHKSIGYLWSVLGSYSAPKLRRYLSFVWGRTRLPSNIVEKHRVTYTLREKGLPGSQTCFFQLQLGEYASEEEFRAKLDYGIEHCKEIVEEGREFVLTLNQHNL